MNSNVKNILQLKFNFYKPKKNHPDWDKLNKDAIKLAKKILLNIEIQKNPIQKTIFQKRKLLALIRTLKNMLINKIRMSKSNHDFIPIFWIYTMTNACNFLCTYCSNHRGGKYPLLYKEGFKNNLNTEQAKSLIKIMKESSVIYFCGGEPTLRKDLPILLDYSTKLNMFNMINTNGSLIGDLLLKPEYKKFLLQMDVIIISLDSLSIPQLSEIYQVTDKISYKVLRNILTLKILQNYVPFKLVANTVITKDSIEECFSILDWCNDLNIVFSPVSANINHEPDYELINNPRYLELVDKILERAEQGYPMIASKKMLEKLLKVTGFNCFPTVFDHIDYNGKLYWPCKAYPDCVMIDVLKYKNVKQVHKAARKIINPNYFHGDGNNQCQGHCAWMQNCVTDTYGRALIEGFIESGIFKEIVGLL